MSFESNIKDIKNLYSTLYSKDSEVILTYKGTSFGITEPWHLRCDNVEVSSVSYIDAANKLFLSLKKELEKKIDSSEKSTAFLKKVLQQHYQND